MEWEFLAGALVRRHVRNLLKEFEFRDQTFRWHETKGLFESRFIARGSADALDDLRNKIRRMLA